MDLSRFDERQKDIYTISMVFLISRFSDNYHLLFLAYALIFGFFYIKSLGFLLKDKNFRQSLVCLLIVFLFTFSNPIFNINTVRFWTASWIAVYGFFKIVLEGNYKYIFLFGILPFVHISSFIFILFLIPLIFLIRYQKLWIAFFIISFFSGMFLQHIIMNYLDYFPEVIQSQINSYASESAIIYRENLIQYMPTYATVLNSIPYYYLNLLVFIFIVTRRKTNYSSKDKNMFALVLILFSFANFAQSIPSLGVRFVSVGIPFLAYLWLRIWGDKRMKWYIYAIPLVSSYSILYWVRNMISISEPYLYLASLPHIVIRYLTDSHVFL